VKICGVQLENPLILASGILGITKGLIERVAKSGAGAIVTKSCGEEVRNGYENPTVLELDHGILNAMGLPNPGVDNFRDELLGLSIPVIGSVIAEPGCERVASKLEPHVNAVELNLSCPHVKGAGAEISRQISVVEDLIKSIKREVDIPLFVKLGFDLNSSELAGKIQEIGADAIVVMNTIRAMAIDIDMRRPILSNKFGGLSGPAVKPIGIGMVYELYEVGIRTIIGCGGITRWEDVVEYLMAGASAVEIGSGIFYRGLDIFQELGNGLEKFMDENGFSDIGEMVGLAHG